MVVKADIGLPRQVVALVALRCLASSILVVHPRDFTDVRVQVPSVGHG